MNGVYDVFVDWIRVVLSSRCPSKLKLDGVSAEIILKEVSSPCPIRSLSFVGDMQCLEETIDYLISLHAVFEYLDFISYRCYPPSSGISTLAYASCVTGVISPFPSERASRAITVFLRVPVKCLAGEGYTIHRVGIDLLLHDPEKSVMTFYPTYKGNFI